MTRARVAVLISGSGTNMAALLYASRMEDAAYDIVLVASNDPQAGGLALAKAEGVPTFSLSHKGMDRAAHEDEMDAAIRASGATHVALAGYMRVLGEDFVRRWEGRMLNIHPSLLPKYKGLHTHARALEAGDSHAGATVHLVTAELDAGEILGQAKVAILPGDTEDALAKRVLIAEHQLYSRVLNAYVGREFDAQWLSEQVRCHAMALPGADEVLSHGMVCFGIAGGKKFAYVSANHHGDGKTSLLVKISGAEEQAMLIERDENRYYRPAYFGDGWIGLRLDLGDTDWGEVAERLAQSWRSVAPKKLAGIAGALAEF
ncbi:phosphoribosylglycinamide formyltransferase [Altererythrobacter sp. CC-YST694]|uniref:phosphoribosylglycinamide formyltransferase n=1 Tax=Altererythrobacter sp. CC-YST694 TaxID=2755038 RepID=UPI001D016154|nr:phosphoribosylglycinamide formyltransferase [Altererythrobacter sp. CC-YST694]MCB5424970.1 phosphoribosylglycinamide formyltransferase [Altererythrobacter sp. CC-YST694]